MPNIEIELNPVDFVTIGTIGPKGQRVFHLQAGKGTRLVSLIIEKEQARALSEAIRELISNISADDAASDDDIDFSQLDMDLREPIEPVFRVAQMGIGYDEAHDAVVLVAQEMLRRSDADDDEGDDDADADTDDDTEPSVVRLWCTREQVRALSRHAMDTVQSGRADPKQNGRLVYYWT